MRKEYKADQNRDIPGFTTDTQRLVAFLEGLEIRNIEDLMKENASLFLLLGEKTAKEMKRMKKSESK